MPPTKCKFIKNSKGFICVTRFHPFFISLAPGPANFTLKPLVGYRDHDFNSSKVRRPQWTMGKSLPMNFEYKSPGPATVNIENFTRYGKHTSPTHPMYGKSKGLSK